MTAPPTFCNLLSPLQCNLDFSFIGAGGAGYYDERFIEYDLDAEHES